MGPGCDYVTLSLEGGFLVLSALVSGCAAATVSTDKLQMAEWHNVLFTVEGTAITLRVDDTPERAHAHFNCEPVLPQLDQTMRVGERFKGQIQQITLNYSPLRLRREALQGDVSQQVGAAPYSTSSATYQVADKEEGFVHLVGKETIRVPCPANPDNWQVELAVKPEDQNALLLFVPGSARGDHLMAALVGGRVRLSVRMGGNSSDAESTVEVLPGKWLHVVLVHSLKDGDLGLSVNGDARVALILPDNTSLDALACSGNMVIGDVSGDIEARSSNIVENFQLRVLLWCVSSIADIQYERTCSKSFTHITITISFLSLWMDCQQEGKSCDNDYICCLFTWHK
ncbi:uncharacterized protein [Periplaneta americana]|uniref:uncharacterized protein n=1 Tax=Periplaneta americana TaxID=6978 RepID=UPI0037E8ADBD